MDPLLHFAVFSTLGMLGILGIAWFIGLFDKPERQLPPAE